MTTDPRARLAFLAFLAFLAAALVLGACHDGGGSVRPRPSPPGVDRAPLVTTIAGCAQLETAIEDAVVAAMKAELEWARTPLWPHSPGGAVPAAGPSGDAAGPSAYTTTNAQVAGVDEADIVQNDGARIAALADGALHLLRSWPAEALAEAAAVPIEGWPRELFLSGDQATVFSSVFVPRPEFEGAFPPCVVSPGTGAWYCGYRGNDATKLTLVDVSTLDAPRVTAELLLPGSYLSARRVGDRVRVVLTDQLPYPDGVGFWPASLASNASAAERDGAFDALATANEAIIRGLSLDDWLRRGSVKRPGGTAVDLAYRCEDFAVTSGTIHPGIVTVATVDLAGQRVASQTSLLARGDAIYASRDTLYVAAGHWWWWPEPGQQDATYLYGFDLRDPDRAPFLGAGVVDGSVTSQYDLDEHDGHLRVATTVHARVEDGTTWGSTRSSSQITVLAPAGGVLREVGRTAPFGEDEQLYGMRFLGPRGFAITARQIDPLFTFDLSDPSHPAKVGEVQMPGFISYLHPIDATHLLGVGREPATFAGGGVGPTQVKVQLLDVSDLAKPVAGPPTLVGEGWSWSDALWNPKAFTWLGARGVLAIPFIDHAFTADGFVSDLRLFHVDPAAGITPLGSLAMADVYTQIGGWDVVWSPWVRRGILADDFVYALSDGGVRSAKVAELPACLATVRFAPAAMP